SDHVLRVADLLVRLSSRCDLRVHVSIESDRDTLPGLPPPACSVSARLSACRRLRNRGIHVVVTVAPLLPISAPHQFFQRISEVSDEVVIDHFVEGDGTSDGRRTRLTQLPRAMEAVCPESTCVDYRQLMLEIACRVMPGRVGVNIEGFAGHYLVHE
ncbi:MAG: hypothetical protein ABGZ17_00100, partial [Planctomycetaceae bacterium]